MAPLFGEPNYNFLVEPDSSEESTEKSEYNPDKTSLTEMAFWYMIVLLVMLLTWLVVFFILRIITMRQKTRNPQRRRMYVGSRGQPTLPPQEPTIYVSPANLPPPPKYEALAPPSYEEVVGIHYPHYSTQPTHIQPITAPISTALAQSSTDNVTTVANDATVITVTADERRTSVTVARS